MKPPHPSRRQFLQLGAKWAAATAMGATVTSCEEVPAEAHRRTLDYNVRDYGAVGDGVTPDTAAIQRAIDAAAANRAGGRVLIPSDRRYLTGGLVMHDRVNLHIAEDAELLANPNLDDYTTALAVLSANGATGFSVTGYGRINGQWRQFATNYEEENEWWRMAARRPRLCLFTACKNVEVREVTLADSSSWTLHLLGCEHVLVDHVTIRNPLDVPNCDGIDPDHCRDVEIRNCDITCGDDAIVIKTSRQTTDYGPSANIYVHDCTLLTQDSGLKIGTETTADIHDIRFERCKIRSGCRGLCIQLRDAANVSKVEYRDITFVSRYHSDPWWGRGEAISFTAIPRTPQTVVGAISDIHLKNVTGRAENSVRVQGSPGQPVRNVSFENVGVTLDRWTKYSSGIYDNRPTTAISALEQHTTPGISLRHCDQISLERCRVEWGDNVPEYFTHALEAESTTNLNLTRFSGEAAHPGREAAVAIK